MLLYLFFVGFLIEVAGSPAVGALGIFVTFVQITASFKYLSIKWPEHLYAWLWPRRARATWTWKSGARSASPRTGTTSPSTA